MIQQPMISVVVPIYKVEKYLPECIDSILNQTYQDFELILVDDGSPDLCPKICDTYASKDSRIRVIHKENSGVSSARNVGISASKGKYITFIDSDDTIDNTFFANAVQAVEETSYELYISGLSMETWKNGAIVDRTEYTIKENHEYTIKELLENVDISYPLICICGPWCKLYLREKIETEHLLFDESMSLGEDTYFNLHYFELCETAYVSNDVYYHYRRGDSDSLFSKLHKDTFEVHTRVYDKMQELMKNKGCNSVAMHHFKKMYVGLLIGCIHAFFREKGQATKTEKLEVLRKVSNHQLVREIDISCLDRKTGLIVHLLKRKQIIIVWIVFSCWYALRGA